MTENTLLEDFKGFLHTKVYPLANQLDHDTNLLVQLFNEFKDAHLFRIYIPEEFGGPKLSRLDKLDLYESIGRWGGALGFLQIQTVMVSWFLQESDNNYIKQEYFTKLYQGNITIGNTLSYMKPDNKIIITGIENNDGYFISGKINFASGWKLFDELLIGFHVNNTKECFAIIPFQTIESEFGNIKIGDLLLVNTMQSVNTVSITLDNFYIPKKMVVAEWPMNTYYNKYCAFPPATFMIGIAQSALDTITKLYSFKIRQDISNGYHVLLEKLEECRVAITNQSTQIKNEVLYAYVIDLSWTCVQFATLVAGGLGVTIQHDVQRLYREIVIWAIQKTFPSLMDSWLSLKLKHTSIKNLTDVSSLKVAA